MIDIVSISSDLQLVDSQVAKAANVLQVQQGSLEYAPTFGIDLEYFLQEGVFFQTESFKAYLIQRLAEENVNVSQVTEAIQTFLRHWTFEVGETERISGGGLIR